MKKVLLLLFVFNFNFPCFAGEIIHSYPSQGIYYYYEPNLNVNTFKKPSGVEPADFTYNVFIYSKKLPRKNFKTFNDVKIENDAGYLFDMLSAGINNKPTYYLHRYTDYSDSVIVELCKLDYSTNNQIKYILNPETGKFVKQVEFNNGKIHMGNICNPNWVPFHDI